MTGDDDRLSLYKNTPWISVFTTISTAIKTLSNDLAQILNLLEISVLNNIETQEQLLDLVRVLSKSQKEREELLTQLMDKVRQHDKEIEDYKKRKRMLKWIEDYIRSRRARTGTIYR
jgi:uncharacterized protein YlxW (UPF0749 family)